MLGAAKLTTFLATWNLTKARRFYEGTLGLRCVSEDQFALVFDANGIPLTIQKVERLSPRGGLGWTVESVDATVSELTKRGVIFERPGFLKLSASCIWTSPDGTKIAWFKDPDGNLINLTGK